MNQKVTIIGKINNNLKKFVNVDNNPLKLAKYEGYFHKF